MDADLQKLEQLKKMVEQWIITLDEYNKEEYKIVNYDKIKENNKDNIDNLIKKWVKKFELWEYREVLNICKVVLDIDKDNTIALYWEIYSYYYLWEYEIALSKAEKIKWDEDLILRNLKWLIYYAKWNRDIALSIFESNIGGSFSWTNESIFNQYVLELWRSLWLFELFFPSIEKKVNILDNICKKRINEIDIKTVLYLYEDLYWNNKLGKKTNIEDYKLGRRFNETYNYWYNDYLRYKLSNEVTKKLFELIEKKNENSEELWYLFFDKGIEEYYDKECWSSYHFYDKKIWEKEINDFLSLYPTYEEDYKNKKLLWGFMYLDEELVTKWKQIWLLEPIYLFYKNIYAIALASNLDWLSPNIALGYYNRAIRLDGFEDTGLLCDILISLKRYDEALKIATDKNYVDKKIFIFEELNNYDALIKIYDDIIKTRSEKIDRFDRSLANAISKKLSISEKIGNQAYLLEFYDEIIEIYSKTEKLEHGWYINISGSWYGILDDIKYKKEDFYYKKAIIQKKIWRFEEATNSLTELLKINPKHTEAELLRNILYKGI